MAAPVQNCFVDSDPSAESVASITRSLRSERGVRALFRMTRTTVRGQRSRAETEVSLETGIIGYAFPSTASVTCNRPLRVGRSAGFPPFASIRLRN